MSISLDLALFLRDNNHQLKLSTSDIGVAFVFAFRIGSNPFTWVSQEQLASELGITERGVRKAANRLNKLIIVEKSSTDKRKNIYRFQEFLINYHQLSTEEKKYRNKSSGIFENRGTKVPVNRGTKVPVISDLNMPASPVPSTLKAPVQIPKGNIKKHKSKETSFVHCSKRTDEHPLLFGYFWECYPRKQNKVRALKIWKQMKLDKMMHNICEDVENRKRNDIQWQDKEFIPHPATYLSGEQWENEIIKSKPIPQKKVKQPEANLASVDNQSTSFTSWADIERRDREYHQKRNESSQSPKGIGNYAENAVDRLGFKNGDGNRLANLHAHQDDKTGKDLDGNLRAFHTRKTESP